MIIIDFQKLFGNFIQCRNNKHVGDYCYVYLQSWFYISGWKPLIDHFRVEKNAAAPPNVISLSILALGNGIFKCYCFCLLTLSPCLHKKSILVHGYCSFLCSLVPRRDTFWVGTNRLHFSTCPIFPIVQANFGVHPVKLKHRRFSIILATDFTLKTPPPFCTFLSCFFCKFSQSSSPFDPHSSIFPCKNPLTEIRSP